MQILKKIFSYLSVFVFTMTVWAGETNWIANEVVSGKTFQTIVSSDDGKKLAAFGPAEGFISTSVDSGKTWVTRTNSGSRNWKALASSTDGVKLVAAVFGGNIYTSTDSGANWLARTGPGSKNWISVASSAEGTKLVAADSTLGYIFTSADAGVTWSQKTNSGKRNWKAVASSADGTKLVAVVKDGYIYTSTNSGSTWTENKTFTGAKSWHAVASSDDGKKFVALEYNGNIYTSTDSGVTWVERLEPGRKQWTLVTSSADGNQLAVMAPGEYIYTSTNAGLTWEEMTISGKRNWQSMGMSSDGKKLYLTDIADEYIFSLVSASLTDISSNKENGTYKSGDVIDIDLTFSEPVTSTGEVTLTFETGPTDRTCTVTIKNSKTATCNYTVQEGDISEDLTVLKISGIIKDASGNILSLAPGKNLDENKALKIGTTTTIPSTTSTDVEREDSTVCENKLYRRCPIVPDPIHTIQYSDNILCEGFISGEVKKNPTISRGEVLEIAVNMMRKELSEDSKYTNTYTDISSEKNADLIPLIQTGLDNKFIYPNGGPFQPTKSVSRIEAYALLMKGICLSPQEGLVGEEKKQAIYDLAFSIKLTTKKWNRFRPNRPVTRNEVFLLASQLADWADIHGGCDKLECRK